jgi:hypothetical protein
VASRAGYVESLDDDVEIVVPDDDHGLFAIDVLDPSWVSGLMGASSVNGVKWYSIFSSVRSMNCTLAIGLFFFDPFCEHSRWEFFWGDSCDTWCRLIGANGKGEEEVDI